MEDIENQLSNLMNNKNKQRQTLLITIFIVLFIICFPTMLCDLYYGHTDKSCVLNSAQPLNLTLKDYLLVSGYFTLGELTLLFTYIIILLYGNEFGITWATFFGTILIVLAYIYAVVWNIIGGVIFFGYMDNTTCSNSLFNYVFASLIIKYVFCFVSSSQSKNND